jgi:hypothetical protein
MPRKNVSSAQATPQEDVMHENFREYLDQLLANGLSVRHDEHLSDPT